MAKKIESVNIEVLSEFKFYIPITLETTALMKKLRYDKRLGSCTYQHHYYAVLPFKKWYWCEESAGKPLVTTEELPPVVKYKLVVAEG